MKTFKITVEIEFTCSDAQMARERVIGIPFGDSDCGFRIAEVAEGRIPPEEDETLKPEYRLRHGCMPLLLTRKK